MFQSPIGWVGPVLVLMVVARAAARRKSLENRARTAAEGLGLGAMAPPGFGRWRGS